jgi:predicted ATPase/transcriptional regulator with XRE-family HTH domain
MVSSGESGPFSALLRQYRLAAGLSQEQLAERAAVSTRGVSDLERGLSRAPRASTVGRLIQALGLEGAAVRRLMAAAGYPPIDAEPPAQPSAARTPTYTALPRYLTELLGRDQDAVAVLDLLRHSDVRLLTLTGPGGVGKTRLAVHVASECGELCPDGVAFVSLAALRDATLVPAAIAQAVGVVEEGGSLLDSLALALRAQRLLLVLDNCEQVVVAASVLTELLVRCPGLRILATSRSRLRTTGEQVFPVRPLVVSTAAELETSEASAVSPAVALFVQRARALQPTIALTPESLATIGAICRRLDGLPLAIELAAARVTLLPPAALLEQLTRSRTILTRGMRDGPSRHQALRSAIAWSYDLLGQSEQRLFRRLSVFSGGWTLEAAESVCAEPADMVMDGLAMLAEHSLVQSGVDSLGESRFDMLQTIRDYALDQLERSGEAAGIRQRHALAFVELAELAEPHLVSGARARWLSRLELELDNIRAALAWTTSDEGEPDLGCRLAGSVGWFWYMRGHLHEGGTWLERLLARTEASRSAGRALALMAAGAVAVVTGDASRARAYEEASITITRELGDERNLARSLTLLGLALASGGAASAALACYAEAVEIARTFDEPWWAAYALTNLGDAAVLAGDTAAATVAYQTSLAGFEAIGDEFGRSIPLNALGGLATSSGDYARARALYAESVAIFRWSGVPRGLAQTLLGLGQAALLDGDVVLAHATFVEALACWSRLGIELGLRLSLRGLAGVAAAQGQLVPAARLYAAAATRARVVGVVYADDTAQPDPGVILVRSRLDEPTFRAAWAAGQAMRLDQAVAEALEAGAYTRG